MAKRKPVRKSQSVDPESLTVEQLASALSSAGATKITAASIQQTIGSGAPTNADGTIDFVKYTAWLGSEVK